MMWWRCVVVVLCITWGTTITGMMGHDSLASLSCNDLLSASKNIKWARWSNPSTWPTGRIPKEDDLVEIPCGKAILVDIVPPRLGGLIVNGFCKFQDKRNYDLVTPYVLVRGQLQAGLNKLHFQHRLTFTLIPDPNRQHLKFTDESGMSHDVGHKAFAVAGGKVKFHGMQGGSSCHVWTKLVKTASIGDTSITVESPVNGCWRVGDTIVISSTDYDMHQTEERVITFIGGEGKIIGFQDPIQYIHWGELMNVGSAILDQRAEVGLITRNIVIQGQEEAEFPLEGGHFIVYHTDIAQEIQGVEFKSLGQQGNQGRYPLHFHMGGYVDPTGWIIRQNSIHHTKQRCLVVHGTHNLVIEENVAYHSHGHCYFLEDGIETGNKFIRNLGVLNFPVEVLINNGQDRVGLAESDNTPSIYWISNPQNEFYGNVAAGSFDTGFWFEMAGNIRGVSAYLPGADSIHPRFQEIRGFKDNVAHSCERGLRTYPNGHTPMTPENSPGVSYIIGFVAYKNGISGMFLHNSNNIVIDYAVFMDNNVAVDFDRVSGCVISNSIIIGESDNYGTCDSFNANRCRRLKSCGIPGEGEPSRSIAKNGLRNNVLLGIHLHQHNSKVRGQGNHIQGLKIGGYKQLEDNCRTTGAIGVDPDELHFFDASNTLQNVEILDDSIPFWLDPKFTDPSINPETATGKEQNHGQRHVALYDMDGSITSSPGYVVANNPGIFDDRLCQPKPDWNAVVCPGACYRTVQVKYTATSNPKGHHTYAKLYVTWTTSSGKEVTDIVSPQVQKVVPYIVRFSPNLPSGHRFKIELKGAPEHVDEFIVNLMDNTPCKGDVELLFPADTTSSWIPESNCLAPADAEAAVAHGITFPAGAATYQCATPGPALVVYLATTLEASFKVRRKSALEDSPCGDSCTTSNQLFARTSIEFPTVTTVTTTTTQTTTIATTTTKPPPQLYHIDQYFHEGNRKHNYHIATEGTRDDDGDVFQKRLGCSLSSSESGTSLLHKYLARNGETKFYTLNPNTIGTVTVGKVGKYGFTYQGNLGYIYLKGATRLGKRIPLYRYFRKATRDYFLTANPFVVGTAERGMQHNGFVMQQVVGYLPVCQIYKPVGFFRYYHLESKTYLYTAFPKEIGSTVKRTDTESGHWYQLRTGCLYLRAISSHMVPLYRLESVATKDNIYTVSLDDEDLALSLYEFRGIVGFVFTEYVLPVGQLVPLYRYVHGRRGNHFYTTSSRDVGTIQPGESGKFGYRFQQIECYILPRTKCSTPKSQRWDDI